MAAQTAPAVVDDRTLCIFALGHALAHLVVEEGVIEPEGIAEILHIFALLPLLPVEPPEVHALLLERMDDGVEVGVSPLSLVHSERHRSLVAGLSGLRIRTCELVAAFAIDIALRAVIVVGAGEIILDESLITILVWLYA